MNAYAGRRSDPLARALDHRDAAAAAMLNGDPGPYIDFWAVLMM
jgi:hypothetical protein